MDVNTGSESDENYNGKQTALMIACKNGYSAIVSKLVEVPELDIKYAEEEDTNKPSTMTTSGDSQILSSSSGKNSIQFWKEFKMSSTR